jgi:site-specific DNA-methyltransferase (adenine-specific)
LAQRAIEIYSFKGDLVCDPFGGSGTTAVAAIRSSRRFVSIDLSKTFCAEAKQRIQDEMNKNNTKAA